MNETEKNEYFEKYLNRTHLYGKIGIGVGILLLLASPFLMGFSINALPDMGGFSKGLLQVAIIYIPSCIVEFLVYLPMLGSGGSYLAFLTGNIINMKMPCAMNSRDIVGTEPGTAEDEIVTTLSVATSALVTTAIIAAGVILLIPLRPVLESPVLAPAFNNVVPALFGAMAVKYFRKNIKVVAIPLVLMTVIFVLVPSLIGSVGFLMLLSGAIAIGHSYLLFKKAEKKEEAKA